MTADTNRADVELDAWPGDEAARAALAAAGLGHVMALDVPPVENGPHWHHFDSRFYLTAGSLTLTDVDSGERMHCRPGALVKVPARVLHAESSQEGYSILLGTSVPPEQFGDPVDRPPEEL